MTEAEINRAVQYVTARTSHARESVADVIRTGLAELSALAKGGRVFSRETMLEYVCRWTMKKTGQPELFVREVLSCAGRWLDAECEELTRRHPELLNRSDP